MSNLSETLRKTILILFQVLIILVPFTWTTTTSELFEFPKMLAVYTFTILIASLWVARMILDRKFIWTKTFLDIPLLLFLLSQILATVFSIDRHTSLYGYYSRFHGGLLSTISYLLLYYSATANLKVSDAKRFLTTLIISGVIASVYAFPEHFGHSPSCLRVAGKFSADCWVQDVQTRVFGTFGQPNWLAAFLITIFFLPLATLINPDKKFLSPKSLLSLGTTLLFFSVLLFTKSRSGIAGLALGLLIFTVLSLWVVAAKKRVVISLLIVSCTLLITFLFFGKGVISGLDYQIAKIFAPRSQTVALAPASDNQVPPSGTQLEVGGTESGAIRRIVWLGAVNLWKMHPFFGSGVETFAYGYYNARPIEHNLVSEWDFLYNKAHNEFLNFLSTTGLFGLVSYLLIIGTYTIWSLKQIFSQHGPESEKHLLIIALLSGFWALMVSNFFGFSTVPVGLLFFLYPALSYILTQSVNSSNRLSHPERAIRDVTSMAVVGPLIILFIVSCYLLIRVLTYYRADLAYTKGKNLSDAGNLAEAIPSLQKALRLWSNEPTYSDELSLATAKAALSLGTNGKLEDAKPYAEQAIALSDLTLSHNKVHLNFWKTRARVFLALSTLDGKYVNPGEQALVQAAVLAPTDAKIFYNLASLRHQLGDDVTAKKLYQKTLELKPDYGAASNDLNEILAIEASASATMSGNHNQ